MRNTEICYSFIVITLAAALLTACGGGSSPSPAPTPSSSSVAAVSSLSSQASSADKSSLPSASSLQGSVLSSKTSSSSLASSSKSSVSITLNGVVTDNAVPFASVNFYVGDQIYTTKADANGKYSIKLTANEADFSKPIKAVAKGGDGQAEVEFVSLLPSFNTLLLQAGDDATLDSVENISVNITNVTTAEYALIEQAKLNVTTDANLQSAKNTISESDKFTLAALIKLVVDNTDYNLPTGVNTTLDLVVNKSTADAYLASVNAKNTNVVNNTIDEIKNDASLTAVSPLIGSWYFSDTSKPYPQQTHILITFIDATHYTIVMDVEDGSLNCKDGSEYGTYTWNSTTGELNAKSIIDNNGECGLTAPVPSTFKLANSNTELVSQDIDGNKTTLKKVASDAGIKGSWVYQNGNAVYVLTILDDSHYMNSLPMDTEHDIEYGTYTYNSVTGEFIAHTLNFISADDHSTLLVKNNQLEHTYGALKDVSQRLPFVIKNNPPAVATDELVGSWYFSDATDAYPLQTHVVISFLENHQYLIMMDARSDDKTCKDGIERGTYSWNSVTSIISTNIQFSSLGAQCTDLNGAQVKYQKIPFPTLTIGQNGQANASYVALFGWDPLIGTWSRKNASGSLSILSFLGDQKHYLLADGDNIEFGSFNEVGQTVTITPNSGAPFIASYSQSDDDHLQLIYADKTVQDWVRSSKMQDILSYF